MHWDGRKWDGIGGMFCKKGFIRKLAEGELNNWET
jgi:hypothetical protein